MASVDSENGLLALTINGRNAVIEFGTVPPGWTITLKGAGFLDSVTVRLGHQSKGVSWKLVANGQGSFSLPATMTSVDVTTINPTRPVTLTWARAGGHLTLADGACDIRVGDDGTGEYSVTHRASDQPPRPLVLSGQARLQRLSGPSTGLTRIKSLASTIELVALAGPVEIAGACRDVTGSSGTTVSFTGSVSGKVDLSADRIEARDFAGSGKLTARELHFEGKVLPGDGRLAIAVRDQMWCKGGLENVDVSFTTNAPGRAVATIGTGGPNSRLQVVESGISSPQELEPATVAFSDCEGDVHVVTSTFMGRGDLEVAGHLNRCTIAIEGDVRCSGWIVSETEQAGRVTLQAGDVIIGGLLDLAGSTVRVGNRLHANAVANGKVDELVPGMVVAARALRSVTASARVIRVAAKMRTDVAIEDSHLTVDEHLHVVGQVDTASTISLRGDGSFDGNVACKSPLFWEPGPPWESKQARSFLVRGECQALRVRAKTRDELRAVMTLGAEASILDLSVDGALALYSDRSISEPLAKAVHLGRGSELVVGAALENLPFVVAQNGARICAIIDSASTEFTVGLVPDGDTPTIRVDAGAGTVRLVTPMPPSGAATSGAGALCVEVERGTLGIDTVVARVACQSGSHGLVTLDITERGRVNAVHGSFGLVRLEGRIHGGDSADHAAGPPVLRQWHGSSIAPLAAGSSAVSTSTPQIRRAGQLIDVDISQLPGADVSSLAGLNVLSPAVRPLIRYARDLGPSGHGGLAAYLVAATKRCAPSCDDNVKAEAQRLREIADCVRSRANSGSTYTAAQWAAAHAHALQVRWLSGERLLRWLHRWVGYGVRPLPALATYALWTTAVATGLYFWDSNPGALKYSTEFRPGNYGVLDSLSRALLLPAGVLRSDVGGATPFRPAFGHPVPHFLLVVVTGVVIGFLAVAIKNFLLRPRSDV